jgi:hypothetical protein
MDLKSFKDAVSNVFAQRCKSFEFQVVTAGADKHGSYVWEATQTRYGLNRYVTLSFTPENEWSAVFEEIMFGADDGERYTSRTIPYGLVTISKDGEDLTGYITKDLPSHLREAMKSVQGFDKDALTESYIFPRGSARGTVVGPR